MLLLVFSACVHGADETRRGLLPFVWSDVTGNRDMPFVGTSGRARWFSRDATKPWDVMNPRGPTIETRWGSSASAGEHPYDTGNRAADFLERTPFATEWPTYPPVEGHPPRRALPYRVTIVCIQPTIALIRFDPSAAIEDPIEFSFGAFPAGARDSTHDQKVGGGNFVNAFMFGTRAVAGPSMLWFSPDAGIAPTPLDLSKGRATIAAKGVSLTVERRGEELVVTR